jgi:hypothetical protein
MMKCRVIDCRVIAVVCCGLIGCSTHPLPQDLSDTSTVQIVRKIRCEAKEGVEAALEKAALQGAASRKHVERIVSVSTIGFEFEFAMTEDNRAAVSELVLKRAAASAGDGFTLTMSGDIGPGPNGGKSRKNTRTFRVLDKLQDLHKASCGRVETNRPNLIYPITGSIGMAEVVRTYIELETFTDFTNEPKNNKIDAFSDKLTFTTTFDTSASVTVDFKTAVGSLKLTKASLSGSAYRQDMHTVTVVVAREKSVDPDLVAGARLMVPMVGVRRQTEFLPIEEIRDKDVRQGLARRAADARNRVLLELERRHNADEDSRVVSRVLFGSP